MRIWACLLYTSQLRGLFPIAPRPEDHPQYAVYQCVHPGSHLPLPHPAGPTAQRGPVPGIQADGSDHFLHALLRFYSGHLRHAEIPVSYTHLDVYKRQI